MSGTNVGSILESANTVNILPYIAGHPGCLEPGICRNVFRNAHTLGGSTVSLGGTCLHGTNDSEKVASHSSPNTGI